MMRGRRRAVALAVLLVLIGIPAGAWSSLPSHVAWQWSGHRPTTEGPRWIVLSMPAVFWASTCLRTRRRPPRYRSLAAAWRLLIAYASVPIGFDAVVVWANVTRPSWHEARTPTFPFGEWWLLVAVMLLVTLGATREVRAPDAHRSRADDAWARGPALWSGTARNRVVLYGATGYLAVHVALTGALVVGGSGVAVVGLIFVPALLFWALLVTSSLARVTVGPAGVSVAFGPWGRLRRYYRYDALAEATVVTLDDRPGRRRYADLTAVIVRRGEGLRLDPREGRSFAVSVDDAATAAGLIQHYLSQSQPVGA